MNSTQNFAVGRYQALENMRYSTCWTLDFYSILWWKFTISQKYIYNMLHLHEYFYVKNYTWKKIAAQ
jgi:hypothetical protein